MISHRILSHLEGKSLLENFPGRKKKPMAEAVSWTPIPSALPGPQLVFDAGLSLPLPAGVRAGLEEVKSKVRLGQWVEWGAIFLGTALGLMLLQIFLDSVFELPWVARVALLTGDIFLLRHLWRQGGEHSLSDEETALRVEKHFPFLEGSLIGAVELAQGKPGATQGSPGLLAALVEEAARKTAGIKMADAVSLTGTFQWAAAALLILGLTILFGIQTWPSSGVLMQRMVLLNPAPPSGTRVEQVTGDLTVVEGGAVTMSAKAEGFVPSSGHVLLVYPDGRREDVAVRAWASEPDRFSVTIPGVQKPFRYRFFLHDGEGQEYEVRMESAPVIQSLKRDNGKGEGVPGGDAPVGGKIYWEEGTSLNLTISASVPLETATLNLDTGGKKALFPMKIEGFSRKIARVEIPAGYEGAGSFFVDLLGENKLKSTDNVVFSLEKIVGKKTVEQASGGKPSGPSNPSTPGMRAKDLEALFNLQNQPVPEEYAGMVRQYLKNVSGEGKQP